MTSLRSFIKQIIDRKDYVTIVSGLPRSGTSMMMSALKAGGMKLLVDGQRSADVNNPKGYFEFELVKQLPKGDVGWVVTAKGKAVKIISALLEYLPQGYEYRVLFMERNLDEILSSQYRMLVRTGKENAHAISQDEIRQSFQEHLIQVKSWLSEQDWIQTRYFSYNDILRQPDLVFKQVVNFLDDRLDPSAMTGVVEPDLYRAKKL